MLTAFSTNQIRSIFFISFLASILWADLKTYQIPRKNLGNYQGPSNITFYFDQPAQSTSYPIIAFLQGSECRTIKSRPGMPLNPASIYKAGFLIIEKVGISEKQNSDNDSHNCTPEFRQRNTLNQRLQDNLTVIDYLRKNDRHWNRKLYIIGGSEGGMLAPIFAGLVPETQKVVMLVAGNGRLMVDDTKEALSLSALAHGLNSNQIHQLLQQYDQTIKLIKANPNSQTLYLGHTYKWWASVLWVNPLDAMLKLNKPMLLVHGTEDTSVPIKSARIAAQAFRNAGKTNLIYWELPGLDHSLTDKKGMSFKDEIRNKAMHWLLKL